MPTRNFLAAGAALWIAALASLPVAATTLEEAVDRTVNTNPDVTRSVFERRARNEEVTQARAGYLPTLDANAGIGFEHSFNPSTRARPGDGREDLTRRESGLQLRQMLFDGFATKNEVERQSERVNSEAFRLQGAAEIVGLRAAEVFLEVLRRWDLLTLTKNNLDTHRTILKQIDLRSRQGVGRSADLDQVQVRVARSESNVVAAENNLLDANTNYLRVVGNLPKDLERPASTSASVPSSLEETISLAITHNPTLKSAFVDVAAARAQHRAAKSPYYPRLDLELGASWNEDLDGQEGIDNDTSAMLRMRYNLFRGGADQARRRQTAHLINVAGEIRNRTCRQVVEGARLSWAAYEALGRQLSALERQVNFSRRTREAYEKQFNISKRTLLDLLDSENELFQSSQDLVNAQFDRDFAALRIMSAMGQLVKTLKVKLPAEAQATEEVEMAAVGHCGIADSDSKTASLDGGLMPVAMRTTAAPAVAVSAVRAVPVAGVDRAEILEIIERWRAAWADQRVDDYLAFYGPEFSVPRGMSRTRWESVRRARLAAPSTIDLDISAPQVEISSDGARVTFNQRYRSNLYQDRVRKVIELAQHGGEWKFIRETVIN